MASMVYDAIVIGAGSAGTPSAMYLAEKGLKVLCLDQFASPGQGSNKAALGGIRATHAAPFRIKLCLDSLDVFSHWRENHGDDLEWYQGGYMFVVYREYEEKMLKDLLKVQKGSGQNIDWLDKDAILEVVPDLRKEGLIGGTYSPEDGCASPMRSCLAFKNRAIRLGAEFRFNERVTAIMRRKGKVVGVRTDKGGYATGCVINAGGPWARAVAQAGGLERPVTPESHEGGISEPVAPFLKPMVVDVRPGPGSANCYFYQHQPGQVLFCYSSEPPIIGSDRRETSKFLPLISRRMMDLMPKLGNLKVRRTWRGLYPMTPDENPIIGKSAELDGYVDCIGMCGHGYMLGPGVGKLITRIVTDELQAGDAAILEELSPTRAFGGVDASK